MDINSIKTLDSASVYVVNHIDANFIQEIKDLDKSSDMISFHFGFGMWIRNAFELWRDDCPIRVHTPALASIDADELSMSIMVKVWECINQND